MCVYIILSMAGIVGGRIRVSRMEPRGLCRIRQTPGCRFSNSFLLLGGLEFCFVVYFTSGECILVGLVST